ncbi:MAG TPA: hypothetical protein PK092_01795 [Chitinophagaceae bacterium]|nr:hypothetical protein [Chitinophagaceae bacterium]
MSCITSRAQVPATNPATSNLRIKSFKVTADSLVIDSISIIPSSFKVAGIAPVDYRLDFVKAILYWNKRPVQDSILISYRVFPFQLNSVTQRMKYDSVMNNFYVKPYEFNNGLTNAQRGVFDFGTLKAEGSFGRQIGFGNSQDAVLNSTLNLQLSGMLGDSIELQAAITDNNIPIQPDGNTQQLNEFDQVYLQFRKKGWQLNLGDIDLRQNQSYFLNFYKRLQGISFQTTNKISKTAESKTLVSGSVAKGKFTRNILEPLEGNQGPYRLRGANNEFFFIILANTERVFYDGQLLQRGEDQDYVINYNTAEITFTPKRMITKDSRIQVEFEYADRNYLNANLYLAQEFDLNKKVKVRIGAFNNNDAKNSQINQILDPRQKQFLADLGDSVQRAFYPSAIVDTFAAGKILYEKVYIGLDSFYRYSTDPQLAKYNLSFADVKQGNGNYVPDFNGANGKVYRYVPPVGNVKQGQYEPVQILVAPRLQQIINLGVDYTIDKNTLVKAEVATSNNDVNTFSSKDNGDDRGWAAKFQISNEKVLRQSKQLQLVTGLDYEYVQHKFRPLERLRTVEFTRDWGLNILAVPVPVDENILRAKVGIKDKSAHSFSYQFTNYHRSDDYNGFQNMLQHNANWKGWQFNNQFTLTSFNALNDKGTFLRPTIDISKQLKKLDNWRIGFNYSLEQNNNRHKLSDTLNPLSFNFDIYSAYLKSDESKQNRYRITFFTRSDKYAVGKDFVRGDRSLNLNLQTELLKNQNRQLYINTTFRKLKVYNATVSKQKEDETILGRAEYVMNEWKGLLSGNVLYEVGAGQEQRRDFAYLEVPAGTGQYAWIDYNSDGVQQLNEFEIAAFPDQAKFIRIFTPTNEFIKANYITFNYSLNINPRSVLSSSDLKGFKKLLSKIILITSLQTNKKSIAKGVFEFNPFKYGISDTALVTLSTTILNTISFNRFNSKWGVDITNLRNNGKSLLTYGYETRRLNDWQSRWRWNISRSLQFTLNARKGINALYTPQFANRNFELSIYNAEPNLVFISGTTFRVSGGYKFEQKKNLPLYGGEKSVSNAVNVESKYNILQSSSITGKFTLNSINYDFPANTTVSYIMLDGLLPGKNYLWSLGLNKRLANNLEISLQYDGRKAGTSRTVHLGRAAISALF